MNTDSRTADIGRLIDAARMRADELRREAVDEFWLDTGDAARRALRSTNRFAQSLARHARMRATHGA